MYYMVIENHQADEKQIKQFLMVAGEIGSIFKKGSTISAAMGGCQAEIGVSSAMAAGALCEVMGGTPEWTAALTVFGGITMALGALGVPQFWQLTVNGTLLIAAISLDRYLSTRVKPTSIMGAK
jgi:ABC-type glucose/galactose transport system permease subunit